MEYGILKNRIHQIFWTFCVFALVPYSIFLILHSTPVFAATNQFTVGVSVVNDTTPPTTPAGLSATPISSSQINLSWTASTDNVVVSGYVVRRNLAIIATTSATTYSDTGLTPSTLYNYTVQAFDSAFNYSSTSATSSATTQAGGGGGPPPDTTPPTVSSLNPANNATGISATTSLVMNMSESVNKFSGNILVKKFSDGSIVDTIAVGGAQVMVSGAVITITLTSTLASNTHYYIEVPAGAFADTAGNAFVGFSGNGVWSFTTADNVPPVISSVSATSTYTTGTISFTTDESAQATLEWGTSTLYDMGTASELGYVTSHAMTINGLATNTLYFYRLTAKDTSNNQSIPFTGTFSTLAAPVPPDTTPPANPAGFTGNPGLTTVALTWTNPSDPDFTAVRIMRQASGYPVTPSDGILVFDGLASSFNDTGLATGTRYYYTAFARDVSFNYSSGATWTGVTDTGLPSPPPPPPPSPSPSPTPTPPPSGATPPPPPPPGGSGSSTTVIVVNPPPFSTSTPGPFVGTTGTGTPNPLISRLTLDDVIFTQLGVSEDRLIQKDGIVRTNGARDIRVSIPYRVLPEVLKTIIITVEDPNSPGTVSSVLLRVNARKTFYEGVLQRFGQAGDFPFTISIKDQEQNAVSELHGTFQVFIPMQFPSFVSPGIAQAVTDTIEAAREPLQNAAPTANSVGVAVGVSQAVMLTTNVTSVYDLYLLILKLIGLLTGLFRRKKSEPWGVVYDSVTKRPLDPAYVIAQIRAGKKSEGEAITDLDGRYGFILNPGEYQIVANKTHYKFPSASLHGRARDEFYENLYFGDPFQVREGGVVQYNIPLDPVEFDWNEFAKNQDKVFHVYSRKQNIRLVIFNTIFYVGVLFSVVSLIFSPTIMNTVIVAVYGVILSFQMFWRVTHKITRVMNKVSGNPLPFALIKVWYPGINTVVKKVVADEFGRFYFLVPPGTYYITVEEKQVNGSYKEVMRTEPKELKGGVVKEDFLV